MWTRIDIKKRMLKWQFIAMITLALGMAACAGGGNNRGSQDPDTVGTSDPDRVITSPNAGVTDTAGNYQGNMEENRVGEGTFNTLDTNGDGYLSRTEWDIRGELNNRDLRTFEELDLNKDERIDQTEFNRPVD